MEILRDIDLDKEKSPLERLNNLTLERVDAYQHLKIGPNFINTPFYINEIGMWFGELMKDAGIDQDFIRSVFEMYQQRKIPYGWYRGKGSPEELSEAAVQLATKMGLDLDRATPQSTVELMKYLGLGIDCSGLVFNSLSYAFDQAGLQGFEDSLNIADGVNKDKYKAGVNSFLGKASRLISPNEVGPLDILVKQGWHNRAWHVGVVLQREDYLLLAHSTLTLTPNGVHTSWFRVENNKPVFGFKPTLSPTSWEELYDQGELEFRRLEITSQIQGREEMWNARNVKDI